MLWDGYVTSTGLKNLEKYRYHCVDQSIVAKYIGQRWWNYLVSLVPTWVAPNLLTLLGLMHTFMGYAAIVYYTGGSFSDHTQPTPGWVWLFNAWCLFAYQSLDAIDGKQARRTKTSSPLGELFDHGCDAISSTFSVLSLAAATKLSPDMALVAFLVLLSVFYMAQWEEYFTGEMFLGYLNVTEGQLVLMLIMVTTAVFGRDVWSHTLSLHALGVPGPWATVSYGMCVVLFSISVAVGTCVVYIVSVVQHQRRASAPQPATVCVLIAPLVVTGVAVVVWATHSRAAVFARHSHVVLIGCGLLYANLVGKIVLARVIAVAFNPVQFVIWPLLLLAANAFLGDALFHETLPVLLLFVAWSVVTYLHFALSVIATITRYLKINALTMTERQLAVVAAMEAEAAAAAVPPYDKPRRAVLPQPATPMHRYAMRTRSGASPKSVKASS